MEPLLAFAATLLSARLAASLLRRAESQAQRAWAASLVAYAVASGALAWGAAAGWSEAPFRIYYLFGGLLTAALLGAGSLLLVGVGRALPVVLVYTGIACGVALAEPLVAPVAGGEVPEAQAHLDLFPARILAIAGNTAGTLAVVVVAVLTFRRRPLGNTLLVAGVAVAALGSALAGLGEAPTALFVAAAAALLYSSVSSAGPSVFSRRRSRT